MGGLIRDGRGTRDSKVQDELVLGVEGGGVCAIQREGDKPRLWRLQSWAARRTITAYGRKIRVHTAPSRLFTVRVSLGKNR